MIFGIEQKSQIKEMFFLNLFLSKNILPVDRSPQNSTTEVMLFSSYEILIKKQLKLHRSRIGRCTSSNSDKFKGDFRTNFNETSPRCNMEDKVCIVNRAATTLDANFPLA